MNEEALKESVLATISLSSLCKNLPGDLGKACESCSAEVTVLLRAAFLKKDLCCFVLADTHGWTVTHLR